MEHQGGIISRNRASGRSSSSKRLAAIGLALLAVVSPLYIDRKQGVEQEEEDEQVIINLSSWLPLLLLVLVFAIFVSRYFDRSFTRFDPNWIHRVGGSSVGILVILLLLVLVLKCKASIKNWEV